MTEALTDVLADGIEYNDGVWVASDDLPDHEPWSEAALVDPIHAVISARNEPHEAAKSASDLEILLSEVGDGELLLDVGCGYGRVAKYLLPHRVLSGYIGLDVSRVMLDLFRQRHSANPDEARTPLLLMQGTFDHIRLRSEVADVAVVSAVLLHNPKALTRRAVSEIYRVLKPGGRLLVLHDFPNRMSLAGLQGSAYLAVLGQRKKTVNGPVRYYREKEVRRLLGSFATVDVRFNDFQLIPKAFIGLPEWINRGYRRVCYEPIQRGAQRLLPVSIQQRNYVTLTVIAKK